VKAHEINKAIYHLDSALSKVINMLKDMNNGTMTYQAPVKLEEAWYQLNCCRIYTEHEVQIEDHVQSSMGNINDARCMLESLIVWKKGLTGHGKISIIMALNEAVNSINLVRAELTAWMTGSTTGELLNII